jgi:hypothetical protein
MGAKVIGTSIGVGGDTAEAMGAIVVMGTTPIGAFVVGATAGGGITTVVVGTVATGGSTTVGSGGGWGAMDMDKLNNINIRLVEDD